MDLSVVNEHYDKFFEIFYKHLTYHVHKGYYRIRKSEWYYQQPVVSVEHLRRYLQNVTFLGL